MPPPKTPLPELVTPNMFDSYIDEHGNAINQIITYLKEREEAQLEKLNLEKINLEKRLLEAIRQIFKLEEGNNLSYYQVETVINKVFRDNANQYDLRRV